MDLFYRRQNQLRFNRLAVASAVSLIAWSAGTASPEALAAPDSSAEKAMELVAEATGLAAKQLTVGRESLLAEAGIRRLKLVDSEGNIHGVALDDSGNPVSPEAVQEAVEELSQGGFVGKQETELAERLSAQRDAGLIKAVLSLRGRGPTNPVLRQEGLTDEERAAQLAAVRDQMAAIQAPVVDQLAASGQRVVYRAEYAPMVVVEADASAIRAMESRDDVECIYLERVHKPRLNISNVVVQATTVHRRGINGTGVRVGVVESGMIGTHPDLPPSQRILCRPEATTTVSDHKTYVAGVIQSSNAVNTGMAPNSTIVDGIGADFGDAEMMAATDCVIGRGATAINMSFGSETNGVFDAFARFVDATAGNTGRTIVVAVSNLCANKMGSPEIAFNALAVGAFGDNNTIPFAGDVPPCTGAVNFSAFRDPLSPHGDREEPDLVAPGHLIDTTNTSGGFSSVSGTSFAASHVTGAGGLLQGRAIFDAQNVRARAILMASARHNIEGASRLSEKDGTGGILLAAADRVLLNSQSFWFTKPGGAAGFPHNQTFTASAGQKVRVVVVWSHKTPLGNAMTEPTTDLDLTVLRPRGRVVGSSTSFDNNYEIVEFTARVTGAYTARITNFRASDGMESIGLAVSRTDS
ncbi:MAG: S8 family peptidase [Gammaproteobacteria bacterium]